MRKGKRVSMESAEDSATFYLGRRYDPEQGTLSPDQVLYPLDDLTTHAVCIGMTGSGKTGLGIDLLEEAALDGIPSLVIDPKGDLTNLLLTFPTLSATEFEPWVDADSARRRGLTIPQYAAEVSARWRAGLAEWGLDGARVAKLKGSADFVIYTPGSEAGLPVSVLRSLQAPDLSWDDAADVLRELVASTVSALLALVGIEADPVHGREHILLSHIIEDAWRQAQNLDLVQLVNLVQRPPMAKLGVFDVDAFFPEQDRFRLAATFNNLIASPSFANWLTGEPLDVGTLLFGPGGKPRVAIFYLAHLGEAEQMFFTTLLLGRVLTWMRSLSGTPSLRALLYFDEVYGYVPPYPANPPSKGPLISLLKTARAFGLGVVLATQNPVDLDYKGLTNAGTWFIGKLQTERDKARLLDGLDSADITGDRARRSYLDRLISGLEPRTFILHNVHAGQPIIFKTRWTLSYLRGPLTPNQIHTLMQPLKSGAAGGRPSAVEDQGLVQRAPGIGQKVGVPTDYSAVEPRIQARVPVFYFPADLSDERAIRAVEAKAPRGRIIAGHFVYQPFLFASVSILYTTRAAGAADREHLVCLAPLSELGGLMPWAKYVAPREIPDDTIASSPYDRALYAPLPPGMFGSVVFTRLRQELVSYVYRARALASWVNPQLKLQSMPGESERDFAVRCQEDARRLRDQELDRLEQKIRSRDRVAPRPLRARGAGAGQDEVEYRGRKRDEVVSAGRAWSRCLLGRRSSRRVSQASVRRRLTSEARADVKESQDAIAYIQQRMQALQEEHDARVEEIRSRWADVAMKVQESKQRPRKSDILVDAFGLAWAPQWMIVSEDVGGGREETLIPASKWLV